MHLFLFDILSFLGYWNIYCHLYMFFAALFASTCNSAKEVSHWKISQIVQFVWQDQDIYLKFMKLGMGQWAMCWCRVPIFSTVWIWERGGVVLQHCWCCVTTLLMLCYNIVGGARLVSTVSELRGRGGEVPKARLVWPHNERYLWLGRRVTRCHFLSQRE